MTLSEAKTIADAPAGRNAVLLSMAYKRLASTRTNGGVRQSERAMQRLDRRLENLRNAYADPFNGMVFPRVEGGL